MPKEETIGIMDVKGDAFYLFMFCYFFLVFLLFVAYEFWFVFFMEYQRPDQEVVMELCFQDSFLLWKWGWGKNIDNALGGGHG